MGEPNGWDALQSAIRRVWRAHRPDIRLREDSDEDGKDKEDDEDEKNNEDQDES